MVQRDDISVRWDLSPRLITIAAPSVELTIQDLHDTLREIEQRVENMIYPSIISTAGGEVLGGSTVVGLTATLQNACVSFEARTTSIADGYADAIDLTGTIFTDSSAFFISDGYVEHGATIVNFDDRSIATVIQIVSETQLELTLLDDGLTDIWVPGDYYKIWNQVSVSIVGGNLVAIDDIGGDINPVCPTAFVQVTRTLASSATSTFSQELEFLSFEGAVNVDEENLTGVAATGVVFPAGTTRQPCLNFIDAVSIKNTTGLTVMKVIGNLSLSSDNSNTTYEGKGRCFVTLNGSLSDGCTFKKLSLTGDFALGLVALENRIAINECVLSDVGNVKGTIFNSSLSGTTTVHASQGVFMADMKTDEIDGGVPILNINSSEAQVQGLDGYLIVENVDDIAASCIISMNAGHVYLAPSCTNGTIIIRGNGQVTDASGGSSVNVIGNVSVDAVSSDVFSKLFPFTYGAK